jgi:hypothetical protein
MIVTNPDGGVADPDGDAAQVRVERAGQGDGRVYHIYFSATDNVDATARRIPR